MLDGDTPATADAVVVGGGIVGLSVARELLRRRPRASVVVVEREPVVGAHQTTHNSGVIHAGIYYRPGSLKALLCRQGSEELYAYCEAKGIPCRRSGKLIVAIKPDEVAGLEELERRGRENRVPGLRRMGPGELLEIEPHVRAIAALHSPATGVVDFGNVARGLAGDVRDAGGRVVTSCQVLGVSERPRGIVVRHGAGEIAASIAVFCAGAWSDRLAEGAGDDPDPRIVPFRGAWLKIKRDRSHLVRSMIYPVPDPGLPFLGVHFTRGMDDDVLIGPTALLVGGRDAYALTTLHARDVISTLSWPGTYRMARRWWRTGARELHHAIRRPAMVRDAARYVPELSLADVVPGPAGVRAQSVARNGALVDDFVIRGTGRALHVRNAPSPAATSTLALARKIVDQADWADASGHAR